MIDGDAALGQQFLDVTVGSPYCTYQRTATEITSRGNRKPVKTEAVPGGSYRTSLQPPAISQRNSA